MVSYNDLEAVRAFVKDATALDIMYAYEDLVFPEHGAFIIQYDKTDLNHFLCWFHKDSVENEREKIFKDLTESCYKKLFTISQNGLFNMEQKGKAVEIKFH